MPILYEDLFPKNQKIRSYATERVVVTAIRVQDITNDIWFSWDNGTWDNAGGSGHNAPVGQAPQIAAGSPVYIAAYAVNKIQANACTMGLYIDGVMKNSVGQILNTNAGFGLEWNGTLTLATTAVEIRTQWVGQLAEGINFSISSPGGGGATTQTITVTDAITKKPIVGAKLTSGSNEASTDITGTATITVAVTYPATQIHIAASGYLAKDVPPLTASASLIPLWIIGVGVAGAVVAGVGIYLAVK